MATPLLTTVATMVASFGATWLALGGIALATAEVWRHLRAS